MVIVVVQGCEVFNCASLHFSKGARLPSVSIHRPHQGVFGIPRFDCVGEECCALVAAN